MVAGDHDLRPNRLRIIFHQREEPVGRAAGDDLEIARILEFFEGIDQVAMVLVLENVADAQQTVVVEPRQLVESRVVFRALDFLPAQLEQFIHIPHVTLLQERVQKHIRQRRGHRHRQAEIHAVPQHAVHHLNERHVSLRDRLVEPVFLEEFLMLRMAHKRQVGVQNDGDVTFGAVHKIPFFLQIPISIPAAFSQENRLKSL